jgi:molecular chaperone GrpE
MRDDDIDQRDGPVKVVDRRRWAGGETAAADAPLRKPTYVEELERQVAEKDKAIQEYAARYRNSASEFEQIRARLRRDLDKEIERARRAVLSDMLEVVDNLDRAIEAARTSEGAGEGLLKGVEMVRQLLLARLAAYGVRPIAAQGQPFDPRLHEAVTTAPVADADQEDRVVSVVRTGYTIGDDVLRPAGVVVGRPRQEPLAGS